MAIKKTNEEVRELIESRGLQWVGGLYKNNKEYTLLVRDSCSHGSYITCLANIRDNLKCPKCGYMRGGRTHHLNLTGQVFGNLTVLTKSMNRNKNCSVKWVCRCSCGNTTECAGSSLVRGNTTSCGCAGYKQLPKGEAGFRQLLVSYKSSARIRNLKFTLSENRFRELVKSNCHYCETPPVLKKFTKFASNAAQEWAAFTYNGIDRIDSHGGYVEGNVVSCCKTCNYAKGTMSYDEFIKYIQRLALVYLQNKKDIR